MPPSPVGGGGTHPGDDRCIDGALAARMDVRLALGRRTKDTLEYDREINAQSAVGCDS